MVLDGYSTSPFIFPTSSYFLFLFLLYYLSLLPLTFHVHARWVLLILVPSIFPVSLDVVAVRLKYIVQISPPH